MTQQDSDMDGEQTNQTGASQLQENTDNDLDSDLDSRIDQRIRQHQTNEEQQLLGFLKQRGVTPNQIQTTTTRLMNHGMTRRAAILAIVGAAGGAGFMTGRVSADASTSDSDGDIGTPSNRVDVFADGVDANSLAGEVTNNNSINRILGERIASQSPSATANADFTVTNDYDTHFFKLNNLVPVNDAVDLSIRVSTDGGSTFKSGASDYAWGITGITSDGTQIDNNDPDTSSILLTAAGAFNVGSASGESGVSASVWVYQPADGTFGTMFQAETVYVDESARAVTLSSVGRYLTAEAIDTVRFVFTAGNIESGEIDHYGMMP